MRADGVIDTEGRITWRSPQAKTWLRQFFSERDGLLPEDWIDKAAHATSENMPSGFIIERHGRVERPLVLEALSCF